MTKQQITNDENAGAVPVACSLTPAGLATQSDRWEHLATRAMTERSETAYGLRICFRADPGVQEELGELVAVENECCAWAAWTVETSAGQLVLDVRSTAAGIATLHGMFTSDRAASSAGPASIRG
jgi:hypothetical protein